MNKKSTLHVLLLADAPSDVKLIKKALIDAGMDIELMQVRTKGDFVRALESFPADVILSDYRLSEFDGKSALQLARRQHPEIPVVMVTDALTDIEAVELMRAGAKDYVLKSCLSKLAPTVGHVLDIEKSIRKRKAAEQSLRETAEKLKFFRTLVDHSTDDIEVIDPETLRFLDVNETECRSLGYSMDEMLSMTVFDIDPAASGMLETVKTRLYRSKSARFESIHRRKDGSLFPVEISAKLIELDRPYVLSIARNITERKRNENEIMRLNRVLRTLGEGNRALLRAGDETELMKHICRVVTTCGGYLLSWIGLVRHDEVKSIEAVAFSGKGGAYVRSLNLSWGDARNRQGPVWQAIQTGSTQVVQDIPNDPNFEPWRNKAGKYGLASCIALPLRENGAVFGALAIYSVEKSAFSGNEVTLLEEVASDLSFGITTLRTRNERDRAIGERQQYADRLRASMEDALDAISATVEMRDPYTAGHQRRVAHLAAAIAKEMGLSDEQIRGIHLAAIVHDLGKIHIPAEMLSKPSRLTEIEYSLIKVHSQAGYDILKGIPFPWPIAQTVLQHHERLDGSGYPQGLKGNEIILEARILSVADVVEAISSHRPYRPGLGKKVALDEIQKNRGKLYEPEAVDACLRLFQERRYHLPPP